jgi:hypothetical protein|tara:strand:+ start:1017 stop:1364 length:348 start_codon:yes stop_codon:yes gene_type:complete
MSTYYRPSEPIAISEIEEKCKDDFKVLYRYDDQDGQWFRDNDGNFLHFALNEDKEVIDIFRYGGNNPDFILDTLSNRFDVSIISEYDEDYEDYADKDTPVSAINLFHLYGERGNA